MKRPYFLFLSLLIIVVPFLGLYIGYITGNKQRMDEFNKPWEQINSSYTFTQIVDANSHSIWAKTTENRMYAWDFYCDSTTRCKEWVETDIIPDNAHDIGGVGELQMVKATTCQLFETSPKQSPKNVVECAVGSHQLTVGSSTYYALLKDGTIWYWITPVDSDGPGLEFYLAIKGFFLGFLASGVLGIVFIIAMIRATKHK